MDEQFETLKADAEAIGDLTNIAENPAINIVNDMFNKIPLGIDILGSIIKPILKNDLKKKQELIIEYINANWRNISPNQFADIEFLMNFMKTYEAIIHLSTSDKVLYFMNLLKNGYDSSEKIKSDIFDECFRNLNEMSYREIQLIKLFGDFSKENREFSNSDVIWKNYKRKAAEVWMISEEAISNIFTGLIRTGFVKQENVMFPDGKNENPFVLTEMYNKFSVYVFSQL